MASPVKKSRAFAFYEIFENVTLFYLLCIYDKLVL